MSKLRSLTGYRSTLSLEQTLERVIDHISRA